MPQRKSRKKKLPKRVLALPDLDTEDGGAEQPDVCQRSADVRPRHPMTV